MILRLLIAMSGFVLLGLYLHYDYSLHGPHVLEHFFAPELASQIIFHIIMLILPAITTYSAYVLHQRDALLRQLKASEEELRTLSLKDELTDLYNRRGMMTLLQQEMRRVARMDGELTMLYSDLDNLKDINDRFGHSVGDQALKETASILKDLFRDSDIIARIGGDEFVAIPVGSEEDGTTMLQRLRDAFDRKLESFERPYRLSVSTGAAHYNSRNPISAEELLAEADRAMYEMKRAKYEKQD